MYLQGLKNDLKAAMDKVDAQYLNELSMGVSGSSASSAYNVHFRVAGIAEDDMPVCKLQKGNFHWNLNFANSLTTNSQIIKSGYYLPTALQDKNVHGI